MFSLSVLTVSDRDNKIFFYSNGQQVRLSLNVLMTFKEVISSVNATVLDYKNPALVTGKNIQVLLLSFWVIISSWH